VKGGTGRTGSTIVAHVVVVAVAMVRASHIADSCGARRGPRGRFASG
jgi:hypothetical protein